VCMKYTVDGKPLQILGTRGKFSDTGCEEDSGKVLRPGGPFNKPSGMVNSPSGDLYVSDGYRNCRVYRFSADGHLIHSWGEPVKSASRSFRPTASTKRCGRTWAALLPYGWTPTRQSTLRS